MPSTTVAEIRSQLRDHADVTIAEHAQRFFKTGPGQYGEGDRFIGVRMPVLRSIAKQHRDLSHTRATTLLRSKVHEERMLALLILVVQFEKGDEPTRLKVYEAYCANMEFVNNWDLVDCSAHKIIGEHLRHRSRRLLHRLSKSDDRWERRISIMSTLAFIREGDFDETLAIADTLQHDGEDLIQKAVGWMLREVGNRDLAVEESFLRPRYREMPRTMLRYAIERFPEDKRKQYLNGRVRDTQRS